MVHRALLIFLLLLPAALLAGTPAEKCEVELLAPFERLLFLALEKGFLPKSRAEQVLAEPTAVNPLLGQASSSESVSVWRGFERELAKMDAKRWSAARVFLKSELERRAVQQGQRDQSETETAPIVNPILYFEKGVEHRKFNGVTLRSGYLDLLGEGRNEKYSGKIPIRVYQDFFEEFWLDGKSQRAFHEYRRLKVMDRGQGLEQIQLDFEPSEIYAASNGKQAFVLASDSHKKLFVASFDGNSLKEDKSMSATAVFGALLTRSGELYVATTEGLLRRDANGHYSMVDLKGVNVGRSLLMSELPDGSLRILTTRPSGGDAFRLCSVVLKGDQVSIRDLNSSLVGPLFNVKPIVVAGFEYFAIGHPFGKLNLYDDQGNRLYEFPGEFQEHTVLWMASPEGKNLLAYATQETTPVQYRYSKVRIFDVWNKLSEGQKNGP